MYASAKVQSLCGRLNLPICRFLLHPNNTLTTSSSITTPLLRKFRSTNTDSKKSTPWPPSVVSSSSASKFPVANSKSFLSISSSHDERVDQCNTLLRNTIIIRSFSSVRDDFSSPGEKSSACACHEDGEGEKRWPEDMPQRDAVVKVHGHVADPDFSHPWRRDKGWCFGIGLVMSGRRVLTTAHSVDHHTRLKVSDYYYDKSYTATMLAIAPECDLAILTVNDDEFWEELKPVEFGDTPSHGDKVIVDHYREYRDYLHRMTARVLSLGMTRYSFWGTELLAFQVNVGLEEATTSGLAYDERGKCVGLKLQSNGNKRLPLLGIKWQEIANPYMQAFLKMEHDQWGILITEVMPNYPESVVLKPYDVILSIDGININNYGTVPFLRGDWIEFSYLIGKKYKGDKRRGEVEEDEDEIFSLALYEEHVVLCEVLNDAINDGAYAKYLVKNTVLVTFNNKPVEGLKSLVSMVETCNEDFMKFTFGNHKILVLPTNIARSRTPDILKAYSVRCAMSDDLKELVKLT
ncbi:hypothetical protein RHMOL_Rhmol13G0042600 [Rhododendron molle]|uniref:Uncharacterized protein n=1 Tax=Rhododendron molle TaxID=49168 RepID=A0ACC0L4C9_RHOML|nr:hypothetical protein RHMOL_Rhmol13G0042600 [Rhododendron molle]